MLFGFTRSYFQVETPCPYEVMRFLRSLIPKKRIAEIYIAIGEPKQGKTELYRAVMDHIGETADTFGYAPGVPGLVMVVFTMPGLDVVLKVIRDKFPPEKQTTPELVRDRYRWVYDHDRAKEATIFFNKAGDDDGQHPGAEAVKKEGDTCLAGPIEVVTVCVDPNGPEAAADDALSTRLSHGQPSLRRVTRYCIIAATRMRTKMATRKWQL